MKMSTRSMMYHYCNFEWNKEARHLLNIRKLVRNHRRNRHCIKFRLKCQHYLSTKFSTFLCNAMYEEKKEIVGLSTTTTTV